MFKCELCGREFVKLKGLARHIIAVHDISPQEYYDIYMKQDKEGICKNCGKTTYFQNFTLGYSEFCNKACKCEFKYGKGITHPMKSKEVQAKLEATVEKRYGSKNIRSSEYFKNKMKEHFQNKYGTDNPLQAEEVKEKIKQTNLDRYGAENVFASDYGKNKIKETMLDKYGVEHALQDKKLLDKAQSTTLDRFGTLHAAQNDKIKEKMKNTKIKNDEIFCKENNCTSIQDLNLKYPRLSVQEGNIETTYARRFIYVNNNDIDTLLKFDKRLQEEENQYNSIFEKEISNWLVNDLKIEDLQINTRKVIYPFEIDFYIPDKQLALEFNGDYWHSTNSGKKFDYHLNKTQLCQEKGIQLIHIFEYEWKFKKDIYKSIISSALGIYKNRIYARDCKVKEVNSKEAKIFLENTHLQGYIPSTYRIGLYYDNELVQLLCFGKNRFKDNEIELLRACTKLNTQVVGGFSKLLKYQKYNNFISYVDLSKFNASGYLKNGFKIIGQSGPNYKYIQGENVLNRIAAQKHKLPKLLGDNFDESKTESQNMIDNGWLQIYDCGNLKLEFCKGENNEV